MHQDQLQKTFDRLGATLEMQTELMQSIDRRLERLERSGA